ncbi:MAG: DUF2299 domain-containing protein [Candidatus Lokiarchaeota archaeon]|jgi:hypothetical protein|nr:DUF2299 domain-containing protein [Candidatus Lokiarchaeota archaeon]
MTANAQHLEEIIRDYLLDEGILRKRIDNENLEFGYQFEFPPFTEGGNKRGQNMVVYQPKKKDLIIISIATQISPPHVEALESVDGRKIRFFVELKKLLLLRNLFFRLDIDNYRYEISDQMFITDDEPISKNHFFQTVRKVFNIQAYSNLLLMEFCSGKIQQEDFENTEKFQSGPGFSLYT